jgi:hydroxyacylglutathione hydrolase
MATKIAEGVFLLELPEPSCNSYLLGADCLVDPGMCGADGLADALAQAGTAPGRIRLAFLTHCHLDHAYNLKWLPQATVYAGSETIEALGGREEALFGGVEFEFANKAVAMGDGETVAAAGFRVQRIFTPGHCRDASCFLEKTTGTLFSGDTLFTGGSFPRIFPGGSMEKLAGSYAKLAKLGAKTVAPGHGEQGNFGEEIGNATRNAGR